MFLPGTATRLACVAVAGSVGPTGDLIAPLGPLSEDEAVEVFIEQIEGLREGRADVAWIETMSAAEEMRAAAMAAAKCGMPYTITASFDTAGRTMMGVAPAAFGELVEAFDPAPIAYGANCGVGASDLLAAVLGMRAGAPLIAKANAGVPQWHGAEIHYSGTPELMERYAGLAAIAARASSAAAAAIRPLMSRRCGGDSTPTSPARVRMWRRSSRRSAPLSRRLRRRPAPAGHAGGSVRELKGQAARLDWCRPRAMRPSWKTCPPGRRACSARCARRAAGLRRRAKRTRASGSTVSSASCGRAQHRALAHAAERR